MTSNVSSCYKLHVIAMDISVELLFHSSWTWNINWTKHCWLSQYSDANCSTGRSSSECQTKTQLWQSMYSLLMMLFVPSPNHQNLGKCVQNKKLGVLFLLSLVLVIFLLL